MELNKRKFKAYFESYGVAHCRVVIAEKVKTFLLIPYWKQVFFGEKILVSKFHRMPISEKVKITDDVFNEFIDIEKKNIEYLKKFK